MRPHQLSTVRWKPKLSYRYAIFDGDNPATVANENFDPLYVGFYDWGTWWQGEIAGEYFLSNSNLISHEVRLHLTPNDHVSGGVIFYDFLADHAGSFAPASRKEISREAEPVNRLEDQQELHCELHRGLRQPASRRGTDHRPGKTSDTEWCSAYSY
jgi:hypothetical protein